MDAGGCLRFLSMRRLIGLVGGTVVGDGVQVFRLYGWKGAGHDADLLGNTGLANSEFPLGHFCSGLVACNRGRETGISLP